MPSRPSAPSSLASSRGSSPRSNQVATSGCTRSSTKRRVASWMRRSSSLRWAEMSRKSRALAASSFMVPSCPWALSSHPSIPQDLERPGQSLASVRDHRDGDELDLGGGVEQGGDLEQGDGGVVAAEGAPPGRAQLGEGGPPGGRGGHPEL